MPPTPELRHCQRLVGIGKVSGNLKSQDPADSLGHEGVAVKVKVKLKAECNNSHSGKRRGDAFVSNGSDLAPQPAELIGKQHLKA